MWTLRCVAVALLLGVLAGCKPSVQLGDDVLGLFNGAVRDGEVIPLARGSVNLGLLKAPRRQELSTAMTDIFGSDPAESVQIACEAQSFPWVSDNPQAAVRWAMSKSGISTPPMQIDDLVDAVRRIFDAKSSGTDIALSAVDIGCQLADLHKDTS